MRTLTKLLFKTEEKHQVYNNNKINLLWGFEDTVTVPWKNLFDFQMHVDFQARTESFKKVFEEKIE